MSHLVSIVVPVYKVEKYLKDCIDSILCQTYNNLEVILVDDGSPDNCPEICDNYAQQDPRIRVIHKENGGISDARNVGVAAATGDYLMFVDSDDWLEPNSISCLYEQIIAYDAPLAIGCMQQIDDISKTVLYSNYHKDAPTTCRSKLSVMKEDLRGGGWACWGRLYRMDIHKDILFPLGEVNQDEAIALQILDRCDKVVDVNALVYNYRTRAASVCTSAFSESNLHWHKHCKADVAWIEEHYPELKEAAEKKLFMCILLHLAEIAVAPKKYHYLARPLLADVRIYYKQMRSYVAETGSSTTRLWIYRYLPYSVYCCMVKLWWAIAHRQKVGA